MDLAVVVEGGGSVKLLLGVLVLLLLQGLGVVEHMLDLERTTVRLCRYVLIYKSLVIINY